MGGEGIADALDGGTVIGVAGGRIPILSPERVHNGMYGDVLAIARHAQRQQLLRLGQAEMHPLIVDPELKCAEGADGHPLAQPQTEQPGACTA